jgi:hypothetical protein
MATMSFYFTKDEDRVPPGSADRELEDAALVLVFGRGGAPFVTFTKGGSPRPTSTSGGRATAVAIGPSSGGGIAVQWIPGSTLVVDNGADDWHLEGAPITGAGKRGKGKIDPLTPPVPTGANDAHGALKPKPQKSMKLLIDGPLPASLTAASGRRSRT